MSCISSRKNARLAAPTPKTKHITEFLQVHSGPESLPENVSISLPAMVSGILETTMCGFVWVVFVCLVFFYSIRTLSDRNPVESGAKLF